MCVIGECLVGITSRYYLSLACGNAFDTTNSNATKHEVSLVFLKAYSVISCRGCSQFFSKFEFCASTCNSPLKSTFPKGVKLKSFQCEMRAIFTLIGILWNFENKPFWFISSESWQWLCSWNRWKFFLYRYSC